MTTQIVIDPNVRVRGQLTFAMIEDATGPLAVGQTVNVVEPESDLLGKGRVVEIDAARGLVYLGVDWASLQPRTERDTLHGAREFLERLYLFISEHQGVFDEAMAYTTADTAPAPRTVTLSNAVSNEEPNRGLVIAA